MRSESFIVPRSTIRALFYNSALTVCQGFTAAQWWRKGNGIVIFWGAHAPRVLAIAPSRSQTFSYYHVLAKASGFGEGAKT